MSDETNGGPAFPTDFVKHEPQEVGNYVAITEHSPGMTLRDYFAAKALQGMVASGVTVDIDGEYLFQKRAATAYAIADAMLAARSAS